MKNPPNQPPKATQSPLRCRRNVLTTLAGISSASLSGCITFTNPNPRYHLSARLLGSTLTNHFTWKPPGLSESIEQELISETITQDSVTTTGFFLSGAAPDSPTYVERNGTYYEISVSEGESVTQQRWLFWFDRIDGEPPDNAEVYVSSLGLGEPTPIDTEYGLSEADVHAVENAEGRMAPEYGFIDLEDEPPERRGHLFLRRSSEETDLIPDASFTHVAFEAGDGMVYARAVTEMVSVELSEFVHTATSVGSSAEAYDAYLNETYLEIDFASKDLTKDHQSIFSRLKSGYDYEETTPLSDEFKQILEWIGVADTEQPKPRFVEFSDDVYFKYDGTCYEAQLEIFG